MSKIADAEDEYVAGKRRKRFQKRFMEKKFTFGLDYGDICALEEHYEQREMLIGLEDLGLDGLSKEGRDAHESIKAWVNGRAREDYDEMMEDLRARVESDRVAKGWTGGENNAVEGQSGEELSDEEEERVGNKRKRGRDDDDDDSDGDDDDEEELGDIDAMEVEMEKPKKAKKKKGGRWNRARKRRAEEMSPPPPVDVSEVSLGGQCMLPNREK